MTRDIDFESLYQRALGAAARQDLEGAVRLYGQAILQDPSRAETFYKLGNALRGLGRLDAAIVSYTQAIERRSDYAYAYCNRGAAQQALGRTTEALASYDQAIGINPADAMSHYNRAILMQECGRWDEALTDYGHAIDIDPQFADAQYNRAVAQLFCGDFENGWKNYEWRWKNSSRLGIGQHRSFPQPLWLGRENVAGKRVLLHSEGGLGDTLQFCRYAPLLARRGAIVYLEVQPPLVDFLRNVAGVVQVMAKGETLPSFDLHCPLMSLPLAFNTTLSDVPTPTRYLESDEMKRAQWLGSVGQGSRSRIGLAWSGSVGNVIDSRRSIRLADLEKVLPPNYQYFCLQRDVRVEDVPVLKQSCLIRRFDAVQLDFPNTAALCEAMDLVISVDTSVAHLSGALGKPTWILLAHTPDWRWMRVRDDTPWYSSVKLYRQGAPGDWDGVFESMIADLKSRFGE